MRRKIEVNRRRRGGIKRGESSLASKQFPICFPQSETLRGSWSYIEKRRGSREIAVTRRRRGESKRERPIQPVIISLNVLHNPEPSEKFLDIFLLLSFSIFLTLSSLLLL